MKPKINLQIFGLIYFVLFFIAVAFNEYRPFIKFPLIDDKFGKVMLSDVVISVVIGLAIVLITWLVTKVSKAFQELAHRFNEILGPLTIMEIFFIAIFSSVAEEFFFRGLLQEKIGIFFASMVFGMLHFGPGKKYLPWTIFAVVMGFLLGGLYEWRGNLIVPIVIHFVVNFFNLILMQKIPAKPQPS
ncbi:MAG: CPBP family intramembrane metalloprotease [Proteobacteria bacterium]|jgi:membrane protease YdiL (CAAX protease family)|nr:CPBP family intramembrane metalloprotease [Pseudomonadota bacterium]